MAGGGYGLNDEEYGMPWGIASNRCALLDAIYGYYKTALDLLPLEEMPALTPRLLDHGACFGFADPVTNIIANTTASVPLSSFPGPADDGGNKKRKISEEGAWRVPQFGGSKKRKRKILEEEARRESVLSKIRADPRELSYIPRPVESRTVAERSLEGLVTFLTTYFRHLPTKDALRYLRLANADLLVAVRLIEHDRRCRRKDAFRIPSHATKIALKCAAFSARLLHMDTFLNTSFSVARCVHDVHSLIMPAAAADCNRLSVDHVRNLHALLKPYKVKGSKLPMNLAAARMYTNNARIEKPPVRMTESLRSVLMDRIHSFYLKAVSRLPMDDLRAHLHRGLLKAGYCFGLFDPVSNIIVNTIWYGAMFPAHQEFEVDMLCTELFTQIEYRSLDGLVAFLRACVPTASEHDAVLYLLKCNVKLRKAISMAKREHQVISSCDVHGHKAAADASRHPEADAYVKLALEGLPSIQVAVRSSLKSRRAISSEEIISLSRLLLSLSNSYPAKPLRPTVELTKEALKMCTTYWENFIADQSFVRGKIKAALHNYEQSEGILYELRVVCAMNKKVGSTRSFYDHRYLFSHVNFWASTNGSDSLMMFFTEISNDAEDDQQPICYPVLDLSPNVRCCHCEYQGIRIMHPASGSYKGGAMDFEKIALGEHGINKTYVIGNGVPGHATLGIFRKSYIYFHPARDAMFVEAMNESALDVTWDGDYRRNLRDRRERECNIKDNKLEDYKVRITPISYL